jgi:hypothetical protein
MREWLSAKVRESWPWLAGRPKNAGRVAPECGGGRTPRATTTLTVALQCERP